MSGALDLDPRYATPRLTAPSEHGYLHLAAHVDAPSRSGPIFSRGPDHSRLLAELGELSRVLEEEDGVERASVFDAVLIVPPGYYRGEWGSSAQPPHFDVVVLVETRTPDAAREVQGTLAYRRLLAALGRRARRTHVVAARNARRIADVEPRRSGLFAFRYFVAADAGAMLPVWDHLAGWYEAATALDNGTLLLPLEGERSDYVAIDHARWDVGVLRWVWWQLSKESFWRVVRPSLETNQVGAMEILYRLAPATR
jgi:hypothetical protein